MANILDGFTGKIPPNGAKTIENNVQIALDATKNMSPYEKAQWLKSKVQTGDATHQKGEWDYKHTLGDTSYADFGNFNYGVVARLLFNETMVMTGAGGAQLISSGDLSKYKDSKTEQLVIAMSMSYKGEILSEITGKNYHLDNEDDVLVIQAGMKSVEKFKNLKDSDGLNFLEVAGDAILNKITNYGKDIFNGINTTISTFEKNVYDLWKNNFLSNSYYTSISEIITPYLINNVCYQPTIFDNSYLNPIKIGAFYESSTSQIDNSSSIAKKTFKLLNSSNQTISKNQLNDLDVNKDGKLSGNEIGTLKTWKDLNEDGIAQTGEITSLTETIYQKDYDTFTKGNSIFQNPTTPTQAVKQNVSYITPTSNYRAVSIPTSNYSTVVKTVTVPTIPNSNFDTLRNSDNVYVINYIQKINWSVNQVKINNSNRTYMIGTNGNDSFDYRYYAQYSSWFNVNILRNFLGENGFVKSMGNSRFYKANFYNLRKIA